MCAEGLRLKVSPAPSTSSKRPIPVPLVFETLLLGPGCECIMSIVDGYCDYCRHCAYDVRRCLIHHNDVVVWWCVAHVFVAVCMCDVCVVCDCSVGMDGVVCGLFMVYVRVCVCVWGSFCSCVAMFVWLVVCVGVCVCVCVCVYVCEYVGTWVYMRGDGCVGVRVCVC